MLTFKGIYFRFIHKTKWGFLFVWVVFTGISFISLNVDCFLLEKRGLGEGPLVKNLTQGVTQGFTRGFTKDFTEDFTKDFTKDLSNDFAKDFTKEFNKNLSRATSAQR